MLPGNDHLAQAREILVRAGLPPAERMMQAWPLFWKGFFYEPEWPAPLRARAAAIVGRVLGGGHAITTVSQMADPDVQELVNDLRRFIDDFQRHAYATDAADIQVNPLKPNADSVPS